MARKYLYNRDYESARVHCSLALSAGAPNFYSKILKTDRITYEKILQLKNEEQEIVELNKARHHKLNQLQKIASEHLAIIYFEKGEQFRIDAEIANRFFHLGKAQNNWKQAIKYYDKYLKEAQYNSLLWSVQLNYKCTSPTYMNDAVFIGSEKYLKAFNVIDGNIIWQQKVGDYIIDILARDDTIYVTTKNCLLAAYASESGVKLWEFSSCRREYDEIQSVDNALKVMNGHLSYYRKSVNGCLTKPIIIDDFLYIGTNLHDQDFLTEAVRQPDGKIRSRLDREAYLIALNKNNGEEIWKVTSKNWILIAGIRDGVIFTVSGDNSIRTINLDNGNIIWQYNGEDEIFPPTFTEEVLISGSIDGYLRGFNIKTGQLLWKYKFPMNYKKENPPLGITQILKTQEKVCNSIYSPIINDNTAYSYSDDFHLRSFDIHSGRILWDFESNTRLYEPLLGKMFCS
ncbi:hypothetical protein D1AOALGA4SA_2933 [Olavius algarvensis Delta 1 endosymbiont]|nr:hypothetical protein D1AOALGA4SA_2933 [Olavius algarvensis Delta 1 endosymbiont]